MKKDNENDLTILNIQDMKIISNRRYEDLKMSATKIREEIITYKKNNGKKSY